MIRPFTLGLAAVLAIVAGATACPAATIEIVQYGVYTSEQVEPPTGDFETMRSARVTRICHVMTTSTVPAGGGEFGFRYRVSGSPIGRPVDITHVLTYPDFRKPRGSPVSYVINKERGRVFTGDVSYRGWFNRRSIPGPWTFQIWENDRKLAEAVFTVVERGAFKIQPDGDSTCFLMSNLEGAMKWHWT
jgi:hypothetical protein